MNPLSGDPDLYISEGNSKSLTRKTTNQYLGHIFGVHKIYFPLNDLGGNSNPSFMPEDYAISSASCGIERIDINRNFKRPINIAVYGHPYYEVCVKDKL